MSGTSEQIFQLKRVQKRKRKQIESYKKMMWKHLFILNLLISVAVLYYLEDAYVIFGNALNFIIATFSFLFVISLTYYVIVNKLKKRRKKELKRINTKLYKLMKLDYD